MCTHPQISLGRSSQGEWGGRGMWHAWERREKCTRFWWESSKEDHWEDRGIDGRVGSEWILGRLAGGGGCSGFSWLRIRTSGGLLWVLCKTRLCVCVCVCVCVCEREWVRERVREWVIEWGSEWVRVSEREWVREIVREWVSERERRGACYTIVHCACVMFHKVSEYESLKCMWV
jgi:hypothetical protein